VLFRSLSVQNWGFVNLNDPERGMDRTLIAVGGDRG